MPTLSDWSYYGELSISGAERAAAAWLRIARNPSTITLKRPHATVPAQTVRIEFDDMAYESDSANRSIGTQKLVIFGVRDHYVIPDTDIRRGDRLVIDNVEYSVTALIKPPGEVQALCEAQTN